MPESRCCWSAATSPRCRSARCARRRATSSPRGEGLHTLVDLIDALRGRAVPTSRRCAGSGIATATAIVATTPRRWSRISTTRCPAIAWDLLPMDALPRAQLALLRRAVSASRTPRSTRRSAARTTARSAASRRRSRAAKQARGLQRRRQQLPLLEPGARRRADRPARRRATASATSRSPTRCSCCNRRHVAGICDGIIERGYDLNIWAYARVDTVKDGMLDKLRARRLPWLAFGIEAADERVRDGRRQALQRRRRSTTRSRRCGRGHQRDRQLHLRPARGRPRHACRRRSTWRSS